MNHKPRTILGSGSLAYSLMLWLCSLLIAAQIHVVRAEQAPVSKRIALTFDDAPRGKGPLYSGNERTNRLIQALSQAHVPNAAFFVTPRDFEREGGRDRVIQYAEAGHLIGNHSNTHPWLSRSDPREYLEDIDAAAVWPEDLPGTRPWFRFPFLDEGRGQPRQEIVAKGLMERGLMNASVTIDNYDWYLESKWQKAVAEGRAVNEDALGQAYVEIMMSAVHFYDALALEYLDHSPAHVLLLHENDLAARFIGDLVRALKADGWTIISPDEAYADPIASQIPVTLKTGQGRVAALAIDAGADPRTLTHLALEEAQIDQFLERQNVFPQAASDE